MTRNVSHSGLNTTPGSVQAQLRPVLSLTADRAEEAGTSRADDAVQFTLDELQLML